MQALYETCQNVQSQTIVSLTEQYGMETVTIGTIEKNFNLIRSLLSALIKRKILLPKVATLKRVVAQADVCRSISRIPRRTAACLHGTWCKHEAEKLCAIMQYLVLNTRRSPRGSRSYKMCIIKDMVAHLLQLTSPERAGESASASPPLSPGPPSSSAHEEPRAVTVRGEHMQHSLRPIVSHLELASWQLAASESESELPSYKSDADMDLASDGAPIAPWGERRPFVSK